jgi:hypothetical protein
MPIKDGRLRRASAITTETDGLEWKKFNGLTNVNGQAPATPL